MMTKDFGSSADADTHREAETAVVAISGIGGNCPVQADGTINGAPFYFRARGEHWSIEVGGGFVLEDAAKGIPATGFYMEREYGDGPYDAGWMPVEEARAFIDLAAIAYAKWSAGIDPATAASSVGTMDEVQRAPNPSHKARETGQ